MGILWKLILAVGLSANQAGHFVPRSEHQLLGGQRFPKVDQVIVTTIVPHFPENRRFSEFIGECGLVENCGDQIASFAAQPLAVMMDLSVKFGAFPLENVTDKAEVVFPVLRPIDVIADSRLISDAQQHSVAYADSGGLAFVLNFQLNLDPREAVDHVHAGVVGYSNGEPRPDLIFIGFTRNIIGFSRVPERAARGFQASLALAQRSNNKGDTNTAQNQLNEGYPGGPFRPAPSTLLRIKIATFSFYILAGILVSLYAFKRGRNALVRMRWAHYAWWWVVIFLGACLTSLGIVQIIDANP